MKRNWWGNQIYIFNQFSTFCFLFENCIKCILSIFTLLLQGSVKKFHPSPQSLLLLFKIYIYQFCECGCSAILYPCVSHACLVPIEARKQCQDSLGLELQILMSYHVSVGNWMWGFLEQQSAVLSSEPAFQLIVFSLNKQTNRNETFSPVCATHMLLAMWLSPGALSTNKDILFQKL